MAGPSAAALRFVQGWFEAAYLHEEWGQGAGGPGPSLAEVRDAPVPQWTWPPRVRRIQAETKMVGPAPLVRVRWYRPAGRYGPLPAWLLLHGVAVQGPDHPGLVRFASALAAAGAAVAIPEIPAWSRLELDPAAPDGIVERTLRDICADSATLPGGVVLAGFSFGGPQAVRLAAQLEATERIRAVVGFGGYSNLLDALRFGLGGVDEWRGQHRQAQPDPYGRWVVAANYLHRAPGFEDAAAVSGALRTLAVAAGARGVLAWEPYYDRLKSELAAGLRPTERKLFRRFAPPAGEDPDPEWAAGAAARIARAAESVHPLLSLPAGLDARRLPRVHLVHGRDDPLIPFTESVALAHRLRDLGAPHVRTTITRLFGHARESGSMAAQPVEALRFFWALRALMRMQQRPRGR